MSVQIKTVDLTPKRQTFAHVARRLGGDKPATRYQEATLDLQATENFHYKPLWEPQFWQYDTRKTAVVMADWYKPLDPRQYYYGSYNIARANMQSAGERNFTFVEERGLLATISDAERARVTSLLLPVRHLHWGSNMNMAEICQRGYGTAVTAPCIFSAGDQLGMAQIVSRIGLALDGQTGACLAAAKQGWMSNPAWQGVRQMIEDTLVQRDWFELFTAQVLGVNEVVLKLVYGALEQAFPESGLALAMLTGFMADWAADETRWSDAVLKTVAAESEANKALISGWAERWIARAVTAAEPLSAALLGDHGAAARAAGDAARGHGRKLGLAL
ncbi:hypothetical protein [Acidocella sp. KAb 2-4]|uniref:hypothetical protein n=1 Tax=Acidocella sp. KAb 2-4 TaxID=2885158 RepID=UPI001D061BEB|nr:hypothetical protein [Acidocella sp. KAb 2-4]MCB5945618.1 hypothetical protein [Acidocella sp. KAb 2-4]